MAHRKDIPCTTDCNERGRRHVRSTWSRGRDEDMAEELHLCDSQRVTSIGHEPALARAYGDAWQDQVDMAASCLAAAALVGGMPRVAGTMNERQLARYLASQAARRRRTSATKVAVVMLGEAIALAAGCYIGTLV